MKRLAFVALLAVAGCGPNLRMDAIAGRGMIEVRNLDEFSWGECDVKLNGDYKRGHVRIASLENVQLPLQAFTKSNGERFDPARTAVIALDVACSETPNGTMVGGLRWR